MYANYERITQYRIVWYSLYMSVVSPPPTTQLSCLINIETYLIPFNDCIVFCSMNVPAFIYGVRGKFLKYTLKLLEKFRGNARKV